jgi:hypothetical protein
LRDPRLEVKGQKMHRDVERGFSFWRPRNWRQGEVAGQRGVVYFPEDDPRTGFYVLDRDLEGLEGPIGGNDLPVLREGLREGLLQLPDGEILAESEIAKEGAVGFEFLLTFSLAGEPCKRCMRVLYNGCQEVTLYGQGVPPNEYDVFANIFDWIYLTFTFGDLLDQMVGMYPDPYSPSPFSENET